MGKNTYMCPPAVLIILREGGFQHEYPIRVRRLLGPAPARVEPIATPPAALLGESHYSFSGLLFLRAAGVMSTPSRLRSPPPPFAITPIGAVSCGPVRPAWGDGWVAATFGIREGERNMVHRSLRAKDFGFARKGRGEGFGSCGIV